MENQIIRIPYKYSELINTMEDCECGKLMKALFCKNSSNLEGLTLTYYNIIIVDINNLEEMVQKGRLNGKKGGRPKKEKDGGYEIKNPPLSKNETQNKIRQDKINKDNIKENNNKEIKHKYGEYKNVLLTDKQKNKLIEDFGEKDFSLLLKKLDEGIQLKGYKYKDHNLAMRKWSKTDIQKKNENLKTFEKTGEKNYLEGL